MSAEVIATDGRIVTARITGTLTQPELLAMQKAAGEVISRQGKARVLILVERFEGWQREGAWNDFSFQMQHDAQIERMAIVGDKKWEDLALLFAADGLRSFPIAYFEPADIARARAWLAESTS